MVGDEAGAYSRLGKRSTSYTPLDQTSFILTHCSLHQAPYVLTACSIAKAEAGAFITPIFSGEET